MSEPIREPLHHVGSPAELVMVLRDLADQSPEQHQSQVHELLYADDATVRTEAVVLLGQTWKLDSFLPQASMICDHDEDSEVRVQAMRCLVAPAVGSGDQELAKRLYSWLISAHRSTSEKALAVFSIPHVLRGPTTSSAYLRLVRAYRKAQRSADACPTDGLPLHELQALLAECGVALEDVSADQESLPPYVSPATPPSQPPAPVATSLNLAPTANAEDLVAELERATTAHYSTSASSAVALLDHFDASVRAAAIRVLADTWHSTGLGARYQGLMESDPDETVRGAAMSALARPLRESADVDAAKLFDAWARDCQAPPKLRRLAAVCVADIMVGPYEAVEMAKIAATWDRNPGTEAAVVAALDRLLDR